ncbi:FAD binding domain-containing protein [Mycena floridula]|nr:FAD binding domain-containing protein [Mycena floridula]
MENTIYDVVIVGAGPGGLMAAMTLCRLGIKPLVIDQADVQSHTWGRSDAFHPRSIEVLESFGLPGEQFMQMGKRIDSRAFWEISPASCKRIALARFFPRCFDFGIDCPVALRQGLIEQVLTHDIQTHSPEPFEVKWGCSFVDMELPGRDDELCQVTISQEGKPYVVKSKYVIACDGAKSAVRRWAKPLGIEMLGSALPVTWCVLDAVGLKSNFPDFERLSVLRSNKGIVLVIPREPINGKPSARFDIQLEKSRAEATQEDATRMIKDIFHPFDLEWDEVNWWSSYDVGQRIINHYSIQDRLFFVGDANHTHSPRAGLGLNTAILESHNLCWKLALVLKGYAQPQILQTYAVERQAVGEELVAMDRQLVQLYAGLEKQSAKEFSSEATTQWLRKLHQFQVANSAYQAGASITYQPTILTISDGQTLVDVMNPGLTAGGRLRPAMVTRLSDSSLVSILAPFDGRFTIYILVGDLSESYDTLVKLDQHIITSDSIFKRLPNLEHIRREKPLRHLQVPYNHREYEAPENREMYTYDYSDIAQVNASLFTTKLHPLFRTAIVTTSGMDSNIISEKAMGLVYPTTPTHSHIFRPADFYCDDIPVVSPYSEGEIFQHPVHQKWAVDVSAGSLVVLRPDGHVALKAQGLDAAAWDQVEQYFSGFLCT